MMRAAGFFGCFLAGSSVIEKALGDQFLFAPQATWLWWLLVAFWWFWAAAFLFVRRL